MLFLDNNEFFKFISPILLFSSVNFDILNFLNKVNSSCDESFFLLLLKLGITPSVPITTSLLNLY